VSSLAGPGLTEDRAPPAERLPRAHATQRIAEVAGPLKEALVSNLSTFPIILSTDRTLGVRSSHGSPQCAGKSRSHESVTHAGARVTGSKPRHHDVAARAEGP